MRAARLPFFVPSHEKPQTYFRWFLRVPIALLSFQLLDKSPHITLNACLLALIVI